MIPTLNRDEIVLSSKEKVNQSRQCIGYHVFLSWYFKQFNELNKATNMDLVSQFRYMKGAGLNDDDSIDFVLTLLPGSNIHVSLAMKSAASLWKSLSRK